MDASQLSCVGGIGNGGTKVSLEELRLRWWWRTLKWCRGVEEGIWASHGVLILVKIWGKWLTIFCLKRVYSCIGILV